MAKLFGVFFKEKEMDKAHKIADVIMNSKEMLSTSEIFRLVNKREPKMGEITKFKNTVWKVKEGFEKEKPWGYIIEHMGISGGDYFQLKKY